MSFSLAKDHPSKTVFNYAVARLRGIELAPTNADLIQHLILQSLVNESGVARFALEMLFRYRAAGLELDYEGIAEALSTLIRVHAPLLQGSEVAWALWAAIALGVNIPDDVADAAVRMNDVVVDILCFEAQEGVATFDVVEQRPHRNPRSHEHRSAAQNIGVAVNHRWLGGHD